MPRFQKNDNLWSLSMLFSPSGCSSTVYTRRWTFLPSTYKCDIKRKGYRQENSLLPGPLSPEYSLFPASLNHDKLIGCLNPRYAERLVLEAYPAWSWTKRGGIILWVRFIWESISQRTDPLPMVSKKAAKVFWTNLWHEWCRVFRTPEKNWSQWRSPGSVVVAMESTACYHINLYSFLSAKGIDAVVINPLLIANLLSCHYGRPRRTRKTRKQ